jgi:alpha-glucoside transport system substrate-binding protein
MRLRPFALIVAIVAAACSTGSPAPDGASDGGGQPVIEVFSYYRGADADAFRRVLDEFERSSGYQVIHVGTADFAARIQERVDESDVPDVALFAQPGLIRALVSQGELVSIESLRAGFADVARANFPEVLDTFTIGDDIYAIPWRVDVGSLVWYRPDAFAAYDYRIPNDFVELQSLVSQIESDGYTPWCLTIESFEATGWVGTDWIEDIMLRTQPLDVFDDWATGEIRFDDERVRNAFTTWDDLALRSGRNYGTIRTILNTPWQAAGDPMFLDDPACSLHRQLGQAYRGALPDDTTIGPDGDIDVFVMPGADAGDPAPLLLAGEFAAAFTSKPGVAELMLHLAEPTSGEIWARSGGYLSPHIGFDVGAYPDDFDRRLAEMIESAKVLRFDASDTMPPRVGVDTFWSGIVEYVRTRDLDRTIATIDAGYDRADTAAAERDPDDG